MKIFGIAVAVLLLALAGTLVLAQRRWQRRTSDLLGQLYDRNLEEISSHYSEEDLKNLPPPVRRYFQAVLHGGQPIIHGARIEKVGNFLLKPETDTWGPFEAIQFLSGYPPGFIWDARIRMAPGLSVRVRDGFVGGSGTMSASVMGLLNVVFVEDTPGINAGALHRYLAEAVWCPTSLLPSQGVSWEAVDETTARATLSVMGTTVSLDFRFGEGGFVESIFTPERARDVDGESVLTPWQGRFGDYAEWDGMRIPVAGEVEWLLPQGPMVYWRGRITEVAFSQNPGG